DLAGPPPGHPSPFATRHGATLPRAATRLAVSYSCAVAGPDVRYAQNAGVNIAYQVFGEGPHDLILVCGTMSHLDLRRSDPKATAMLKRLGRFSRVILFDKPGTGLSDPIPAAPTVDQRTADVVAVMDAVES